MDKDEDVMGQYKNITSKMKKRFLKKPNVSEGSQQFYTLARHLENQEAPQYSAFCYLAKARCEHSLSNPQGEADALLNAARQFIQSEDDIRDIHCLTFDENLQAAMNSYNHAIRVFTEDDEYPRAASLCHELASALSRYERHSEAIEYFEKAAKLQDGYALARMSYMCDAASSKLDMRDYVGALDTFTDMQLFMEEFCYPREDTLDPSFIPLMARCEITRLLLILLLRPSPQNIKPVHSKLIEKFTWEIADPWNSKGTEIMDIDLFLTLQSFTMACQAQEIECLLALEPEIRPMLNTEQQQLIHVVIRELVTPSGEGL